MKIISARNVNYWLRVMKKRAKFFLKLLHPAGVPQTYIQL
ncbi:hypothetical protein HMPREF0201_02119 [Cedecea davisae DSM 4568]|uniref:Uncharacterized protein n=1 Tax=Cedecea davisae DSM 4568 TaxID=566551 RepID=S3JUQ4_9ENTR|nr:hypothetical protein HMPREF0201_02119 [Cedecea davisae DSM 4568]